MADKNDPKNEGHTTEWQGRARVVLDAKKAAKTDASPNQSPEPDRNEEINRNGEKRREGKDDEPVY